MGHCIHRAGCRRKTICGASPKSLCFLYAWKTNPILASTLWNMILPVFLGESMFKSIGKPGGIAGQIHHDYEEWKSAKPSPEELNDPCLRNP